MIGWFCVEFNRREAQLLLTLMWPRIAEDETRKKKIMNDF